jgi:hypothetical protein
MKPVLGILLGVAVLAALALAVRTILPAQPYYYIHMANGTRHDLDNVGVYYGDRMAAEKGILTKGNYATYGPVTMPVPEEAIVTWSRDTGVHRYPPEHSLKVKMAGIVPPRPRDVNIYFIIEADGTVTVKMVESDDLNANIAATKKVEEIRNTPGTIEDLLYAATPVPGAVDRFVKAGGVVQADYNFNSLVGKLPVTTNPDGSQSATLPDGTAVTVHARKPGGGFAPNATGIIRAKLPAGSEIEIRYQSR